MRFINFERTKLPGEILKHNIEEKKRFFAEINMDLEKTDAEIQVCPPILFNCFSPLLVSAVCLFA